MEANSESNNDNINLSKIINNQNDYNPKEGQNLKPIEYPFQMITKDQEKKEMNFPINYNEQEKLKINLQKIDTIPEVQEGKKQRKSLIQYDSPNITGKIKIEKEKEKDIKENEQNKKIKKKINLNFLSPEIYMRKKFDHTEHNINPVEIKLKKIENEIQKQFDYDYQRVMQQMKDKLDAINKNKDQQKHILEEEQKLKEKMKAMEEYRENKMKERAKKVLKKQNKNTKSLKKINKSNTNIDSNNNYINSNNNNSKKYIKTLESTESNKLPPLSNSSKKYQLIRERKAEIEKEFILNTKEDILSLENEHKENYIYQYNKAKDKIKQHNRLYSERNEAYSKYRDDKEKEKNEMYLQKDIKRRYNVKLSILRDRSEKSGRLKERIQKNLENFQEKKEIIKKNEKKKIKEYLKKINKYNNDSKNLVNNNEKRIDLSNKQKANINKIQKEFEEKYNDFLWKQENIKNIAIDMQKIDSDNKKYIYQNSLRMQSENEKKYQSFYDFLDKIKKNNIVNKTDNVKLKIYNKKVKEEQEEKNRKLEELNKYN